MTRIVVTGGAGFIGSSLVEALLARRESVTVLDDFSTGRATNLDGLSGDLDVQRGDVSRPDDVARALRGARAVLHHAAIASVTRSIGEPARADEVNVHGTVCVLEEARRAGVRKVVLAASAAAYGDAEELPQHEGMIPRPLSPYAVAKVASEHYVRVYAQLHGLHAVALRYFNVFGPKQDPKGEYAAVVPKFVTAALGGERPRVFGDGLQTRDFCYIDDVVAANLAALERSEASGQVINVASGRETSVIELARIVGRIVGSDAPVEHAPARDGEVRRSVADVRLAKRLLGWQAQTTVEEGLTRIVERFRATAHVP